MRGFSQLRHISHDSYLDKNSQEIPSPLRRHFSSGSESALDAGKLRFHNILVQKMDVPSEAAEELADVLDDGLVSQAEIDL